MHGRQVVVDQNPDRIVIVLNKFPLQQCIFSVNDKDDIEYCTVIGSDVDWHEAEAKWCDRCTIDDTKSGWLCGSEILVTRCAVWPCFYVVTISTSVVWNI